MTDFSTRKNTTNLQQRVSGVNLTVLIIDPSLLASYPAAADTIGFFDLPAGARIIDCFIKTNQAVGVSGTTLKLQALQGATATDLTATIAADTASPGASARMLIANGMLDKYTTGVTTIQAVPGTHALSIAGNIEVGVLWTFG